MVIYYSPNAKKLPYLYYISPKFLHHLLGTYFTFFRLIQYNDEFGGGNSFEVASFGDVKCLTIGQYQMTSIERVATVSIQLDRRLPFAG
ncbi:hypothetical protein TNCV_1560851 [Trichonephila clavipes]|nr:hypothetical protein TNCV_1560851 [Trichonephila clavipes]